MTALTDRTKRALRLAQRAPKAELHLHIEGTLEPEMMFALAQRNRIPLPMKSADEIRARYAFSCLQDFLDIYYQGMAVLLTERDFYDLAWAYLQRAAADHVIHAEIFFDPQAHLARGVEFAVFMAGMTKALERAGREFGMSTRLIMCFLRHLSAADARQTLAMAMPHLGAITAVGLDSSENGNPPSKFTRVFAAARKLGLRCVAHAGEEGPPAYIYEAIDDLKVERIDHGNRAVEDKALMAKLADTGTVLTLCPLSNLKLGVVQDMRDQPLKIMLEAGLRPMINSDDPAYFGGYVNANYAAVIKALDLGSEDVKTLLRNSFSGAFLDAAEYGRASARLERHLAGS